ncbi:MAG: hypothetical protein IPJ65_10360 [Archangiaceae bacterium]|nr:hypothetical protein [Archangiaceae bacterium]
MSHEALPEAPSVIELRLERVLAALQKLDPIEAARLLEGPLEGRATPRARRLWEQCVEAMPAVMRDWQRRVSASLAARAYAENS